MLGFYRDVDVGVDRIDEIRCVIGKVDDVV